VQKLLRGGRKMKVFALFQGSRNEGLDPGKMDVSVFHKIKTVLLEVENEEPHGEQGV
jgi:hypothetical protein